MLERDLQALVEREARAAGWRSYHTFNSRRSTPGFPDLTFVHPRTHRLLFAELKQDGGQITPAQADWLMDLKQVDRAPEVYVWRPKRMDTIIATLRNP